MSLLDELRAIPNFTPSHQPVAGEVLEVVGKLVAYIEHGDDLFAAGHKDTAALEAGEPANNVNELLWPSPEPAEAPASTAENQGRIAELEQQVQTLLAQQQRTQATVESDGEDK